MGSEASGPFTAFGEIRVFTRAGSDKVVPILPSSNGFQSSQMLASHSNQRVLHINSSIHVESISPSSDEAENQHVIDERKQRRMLSNRESARRSRVRKQQRLLELKAQVDHLRAENGHILNKFNITSQLYADITEENELLRSQALELNQKLQQLHQTVNAQSYNGFRCLGTETGHCNAASFSLESGTIDQFWASSDLLF